MTVIKREAPPVTACCLGEGSGLERELLARGLLARDGEDYRVFSREAAGETGQLALRGDFVKLDAGGFPYPNARADFLQNHRQTPAGWVQVPVPLEAWAFGQPEMEALRWALTHGGLTLHADDAARFYRARLWGAELSAPRDAVLVFYRVERDEGGAIVDMRYNFVAREEFDKSYRIVEA